MSEEKCPVCGWPPGKYRDQTCSILCERVLRDPLTASLGVIFLILLVITVGVVAGAVLWG